MHVNKTKKIAILGVFAALSTVFTVLGTVISVNTVFFTALAAYLLGIIVVRFGIKEGILFYFVCAALDFFVNPDKMHVILYLALAAYILFCKPGLSVPSALPSPGNSQLTDFVLRCSLLALVI